MAPSYSGTAAAKPSTAMGHPGDQPAVNRKKQKKRQKQAAKFAAEQAASGSVPGLVHPQNGHPPPSHTTDNLHLDHDASQDSRYSQYDPDNEIDEADVYFGSDDEALLPETTNGKMKKNKKKKSRSDSQQAYQTAYPMPGQFHPPNPPPPPPPPPAASAIKPTRSNMKDRIWNTSTAEERERIKEFWISLEEPERRSLVKVEKEAVLKKMKEQQKHSCSCSVCGRKRTAIEEELEVLYDAYYEELEQYANHRQLGLDSGHPMMPPPSSYPTMAKVSLRQDPRVLNSQPPNPHPMAGTFEDDDDDLDDEPYSDDEEEMMDGSEEDYYPPEVTQGPASDFFNFGKSLTVQGGILTVADDLLKNDGKKFIEMMEQLAERRMQREEEAQYAAAGLRHPSFGPHDHAPIDEDEYGEDEGDDYASEDEDEYEEDMEGMTEEQRMEEGRRMFQIFAARMFEQRVLTAYREKVARERQEKLLEELADEDRLDAEREAKKAKDAQKKKDKKKQQKAAKEEEKQRREAEKTAAEATAKAEEEKRLEEQRQKREEQKRKREAEKRAQEEERQRKEAEKLRRQQEAREQQAEQERKAREAKEKEKKRKEEAKKREREERAKERERKDQEAAEKRELEAKLKAEKAAQEAAEKAAKEKVRKEDTARQSAQHATNAAVPPLLRKTTSTGISAPPGLGHSPSTHASPHLQIATPVIPKAPTPMRPRQPSRQGSLHSSPKSTQPPSGSSATSPSSASVPQPSAPSLPLSSKPPLTQSIPQHTSMPTSHPPIGAPPGMLPPAFHGMPHTPMAMSGPGFQSNYHPMVPPGMHPRPPNHNDASIYTSQPFSAPPYRGFNSPSTSGFPPGINGVRQMPTTRGSPTDISATHATIGSGVASGPIAPTSHSRHASASFESSSSQTQPIARPTPISRPNNNAQSDYKTADVDDLSKHLGSSALLDDTDDTLGAKSTDPRMPIAPGGSMRSNRLGYAQPRLPDAVGVPKAETFPSRPGWGTSPMGFGSPAMQNHQTWPSAVGVHWPNNNAFGGVPNVVRQSRPMALRILICQCCKNLSNDSMEGLPSGYGYHSIQDVMGHIGQVKPEHGNVSMQEFLTICETEGNTMNGGGSLVVQEQRSRGTCVKWIPDTVSVGNNRILPGEIGSPIIGSATMPPGGGSIGGGGRTYAPSGGGMQGPLNF